MEPRIDDDGSGPTGSPPLRDGWRDRPHPSRLDPEDPLRDAALDAHRAAVGAGSIGYRDPRTGLLVMTATYLRERGWCCDRGCRHCPYVGATSTGDRP